jgi:hypothetical protein
MSTARNDSYTTSNLNVNEDEENNNPNNNNPNNNNPNNRTRRTRQQSM